MKSAIAHLISLLLLIPVYLPGSAMADPQDPKCLDFTLARLLNGSRFEVQRYFYHYVAMLPYEYLEDVMRLGGGGHWIDAGAGKAIAADLFLRLGRDVPIYRSHEDLFGSPLLNRLIPGADRRREMLYSEFEEFSKRPLEWRPRVTAISYREESRVGDRLPPSRFRYLNQRLFQDIPLAEIGKADVITDVYGVFAYSEDISNVIARYGALLKPGGKAYILIGFDNLMKRDFRFVDQIEMINGKKVSLLKWLQRRVEGIEVQEARGSTSNYSTLVLKKKGEGPVRVPELKLVEVLPHPDPPPIRRYRETGNYVTLNEPLP